MSENLGDAVLKLGVDDSQLQKGLADSESKTRKTLDGASAKMRSAGTKLSLGLTLPILAFGKVAAAELTEIQTANAQTEASLRRIGTGALVSVAGVQKLSESLQSQSGIDDQLIQTSANLLLTLGNLNVKTAEGKKNFEDSTTAIVNWAEATGTDPVAASKMLAKALADPEKGMSKLGRAGIILSKQQEAMVKKMVAAGDTAGAQGIIIEAVGKKFDGAANLTNSDKWNIAKDKIAGVGAELLVTLTPALTKLADVVSKATDKFNTLGDDTKKYIAIGIALLAMLGPLLLALSAMTAIVGAATTVWGALTAVWGVAATVGSALAAVVAAITLPMLVVAAAVIALIAVGVLLYKNWDKIKAFASKAWNGVKAVVLSVGAAIKAGLLAYWSQTKANFSAVWNGIKAAASAIGGGIKAALMKPFDALKSVPAKMLSLGKQIIQSLARGIRSIHIPMPHFSASVSKKKIGGVSVPIPDIDVDWYAKGGIFNRPSIIGVGEKGPEAVVPLDKLGKMGGGQTIVQNFTGEPDMFAASRMAAFAFRTAGLGRA